MSHHNIMTTYFLFVIHSPVTLEVCKPNGQRVRESKNAHFVVITRPQIDHDVLVPGIQGVNVDSDQSEGVANVPIEEHDGAWVVQLVHLQSQGRIIVSLQVLQLTIAPRTLLKSGTSVMSTR